jgi:hypothetical protein
MKTFWEKLVLLKHHFNIRPVIKGNDLYRKRITLVVIDCLIKTSPTPSVVHKAPFVESCLWNTLKKVNLRCDSLQLEKGKRNYLAQEKVYKRYPWNEETECFVGKIVELLANQDLADAQPNNNQIVFFQQSLFDCEEKHERK